MTELKPCPFCGESLSYEYRWMSFIHCENGCVLENFTIAEVEDSIEKWNTRALE